MTKGYRNLIILTIITIAIAGIASGAALIIYHKTGDIYLDRSRPGFLPEKSENQRKSALSEYKFPENTPLTSENLKKFLEEYQAELNRIKNLNDAFSPTPLENPALGLPAPEKSPEKPSEK